jgi:putative nucleotidyltransferase with HDIG domain
MQISVTRERLAELKDWFSSYVRTFQCNQPEIQHNIDIKVEHTLRVCNEILTIGKQLGLNDDELRLTEIIALLHDVGRFEQYTRYKTFSDQKSEDHAELGTKILKEYGILNQLDEGIKEIIFCSIKYHNRRSLPRDEKETCLFFLKILRDADKLDIWKLVTDYYHRKDQKPNGALELDLPDTSGFSEEVYQDLLNRRVVAMNHVKNLNDFKLLQIGWIFDINFKPTFDCIKERRYLEKIRDVLPESTKIKEIFDDIQVFLGD